METGRGGSPRISEPVVWDEDAAKRANAQWGCWDCGFEDSYVREVDKDTDHIRVRYRQCTRCGSMWETEEKRIARGSFFGRAERRRYAAFRKKRYATRRCLVCREQYMSGRYQRHVEQSEAHRAKVAIRRRRRDARQRKYGRLYERNRRAIAKEHAGTAVCERCGEHYPLGVPYPARTHRSTSAVHKRVVKDDANDRRDQRRQAAKRGRP